MRIQLNNVGVIKNCDVEFIPGINLIVGSSGSGKSTLMRSIYSIASNDFSDSDISFGKNAMSIDVDYNSSHIKYGRSIKSKGEKCFYIVNGESFVKLGRQPLQQVADILKIGDVDVNGEKVNFNFNLQFSSPFLILGSQSTLYNVLTYRSSFDISSINDYYVSDIKSNASDTSANVKLKEKLEANISDLQSYLEKLSPIEDLYSDYISYKHTLKFNDELKSLLIMYSAIKDLEKELLQTNNLLTEIENANAFFEELSCIDKYNSLIKETNVIVKSIAELEESVNTLEYNDEFIFNVVKQSNLFKEYNRCSLVSSTLSEIDEKLITQLDEITASYDILVKIEKANEYITIIESRCKSVTDELSTFNYCPLCGNSLTLCEH